MIKKVISFFVAVTILGTPYFSALALAPNDEYYNREWYLEKIKAPAAWDKVNDASDVVVAVIDSGVQTNHPDLVDNLWVNKNEIIDDGIDNDNNGFIDDAQGWNFIDNTPDASPVYSTSSNEAGLEHGTLMAGIIGAAGNNKIGVSGVAWKVKIMPLKALNDKGEGKVSDVIRAIDYAVKNGADIINLSFVGYTYSNSLREALERAYDAGVIVVAAAGNDKSSTGNGYNLNQSPIYPACYRGLNDEKLVIGVAATDATDRKATFSSYGSDCVDISAPGIGIFNTAVYLPDISHGLYNTYYDGYWSGTSMAAPIISGALAIIKEANPYLSRDAVINVLLRGADSIDTYNPDYRGQLGIGRLNLSKSVDLAINEMGVYSGRLLVAPYYSGTANLAANFNRHDNTAMIAASNGDDYLDIDLKSAKARFGVNLASGDLNGDGNNEIVSTNAYGGNGQVKIFDSETGELKKQFYSGFGGGINVAVGDIDADGNDEIIVAPVAGATTVKVFSGAGVLRRQFISLKNGASGANLAAADVNADGSDEIIVGSGSGATPLVSIFNGNGKLQNSFLAYPKNYRGGVKVAAGNIFGRAERNKASIITAPQKAYDSEIKVFMSNGELKLDFMAFDSSKSGLNITAGDLNGDGIDEIAATPSAKSADASAVRIFDNRGHMHEAFYAYGDNFVNGVSLGFILLNN